MSQRSLSAFFFASSAALGEVRKGLWVCQAGGGDLGDIRELDRLLGELSLEMSAKGMELAIRGGHERGCRHES